MAVSAAGVRSVTSMAKRPPATSARACATPSSTSLTVSTGITGASPMIFEGLGVALAASNMALLRRTPPPKHELCATSNFAPRRGEAIPRNVA